MGQAADDMLNGLCCQVCGQFMDDYEEVGYPRTCESCKDEQPQKKQRRKKKKCKSLTSQKNNH